MQDPFELTHDLGRTVDRQTNGVLHKEFERAACVLRDLPSPLEKLLEPTVPGRQSDQATHRHPPAPVAAQQPQPHVKRNPLPA